MGIVNKLSKGKCDNMAPIDNMDIFMDMAEGDKHFLIKLDL